LNLQNILLKLTIRVSFEQERIEGLEKKLNELQLIQETSKIVRNKAPRMVQIQKNIVPQPMEEPSEFPKIPLYVSQNCFL
jgi:hypothetical protein